MAEMQHVKKKDAEKEKNTATLSKISNAIKGSEKLDVEGTDLLELLSHLEGELQARDVAIAALKSEQVKRLVYGCYHGAPSASYKGEHPTSPTSALQRDKTEGEDAATMEEEVRGASTLAEAQIAALQALVERQKVAAGKMAACLRESEKQRTVVTGQLEEERAKHEATTAQGDDITYQLEKERIRLRQDLEVEVAEKQKLEEAVKDSVATLEEEKSKQKQIVLVLLADRKKLMKLYLEEKKRSEDLAQMLGEEKGKMEVMAAGLEEESKRSLAMEAELEKHLSQFGCERQQLRDKLVTDERRHRELEEALRKARTDVEHFKKQLSEAHRVAMNQVAPIPAYPTATLPSYPVAAPPSISPTPRQQAPASYTPYSTLPPASTPYSTLPPASGLPARTTSTAPRAVLASGPAVTRSHSGPMVHPTTVSQAPGGHSLKYSNYSPNSTSGGFGHPALIAAGLPSHPHMDQESLPNSEATAYSQLAGPKLSAGHLLAKAPPPSAATSAAPRKPLTESPGAVNARKPVLGKGVPPPLPPNKPVVPVKTSGVGAKAGGKDAVSVDKAPSSSSLQGLPSALQSLKFGIPISNADSAGKGLKLALGETHPSNVPSVPAKKFFNNIESKS